MRMHRVPGIVAIAALGACGPAQRPVPRAPVSASSSPAPSSAPSVSPRVAALAGRIWDVAHERTVDEATLVRALAAARFAMLGEVHDSSVAHAHQATLATALIAAGRHPALVFEMIDADRQPAIDRARAATPRDPDALATAVEFHHSGWTWAFYRPLVSLGLDAGVPVVAGNLPRVDSRALVMRGVSSIDPSRASRLGLTEPLAPAIQAEMRDEMNQSHCGMLPEQMLDGMVLAQRARDGTMAERMLGAGGDGAVLIAGAEHARTDRAVPAALRRLDASATVVSVGFVEVEGDIAEPSGYAGRFHATRLPFDYVWFVPPVARDQDVCAPLRHHAR